MLGGLGTGNYVKMIHRRIKYRDMQLIGEVYAIMKHVLKLGNDKIATIVEDRNKTELDCYLIEIITKILPKKDETTAKGHVLDYVLDKTGAESTGHWTIQETTKQDISTPTMAAPRPLHQRAQG